MAALAYSSGPQSGWTLSKAIIVIAILAIGLLFPRRRLIYGVAFTIVGSRFAIGLLLLQKDQIMELIGGAILSAVVAWRLLRVYR